MSIRVTQRNENTFVLSKHGALIAEVTATTTQEAIDSVAKIAYQKGREDLQYELEIALSQLRSSD